MVSRRNGRGKLHPSEFLPRSAIVLGDIAAITAGYTTSGDATLKRQITLRPGADVVDFFERGGKVYQTRINEALRAWVEQHRT